MADIRIKDLPTIDVVQATDLIPFESSAGGGNYTTSKNTFASVLSGASVPRYNSVYTTVNSLSSALPYRTGDKIIQYFDISAFSASAYTTSTTTLAERATFILDIGNTTKWKKSGCGTPTVNFYVVGKTSIGTAQVTFDLYRQDTAAVIANSVINTTSTNNWQVFTASLNQTDFPSTMTAVSLRGGITSGTGTMSLAAGSIEIVWTVL